jgi:hypothetical protein
MLIKHYTTKIYGDWRYSSTLLDLSTRWENWSVQALAALLTVIGSPLTFG